MKEIELHLTVNGEPMAVRALADMSLLDLLRERLGLTGAKNGCSEGTCGACTVLLDGHPVRSCRTKVQGLDGASITTIEGLTEGGKPHPLQLAFARHGAPQCGFCTPAMILTAKALLDENPRPTLEEMKRALNPVLCRCGSYQAIFRAIEDVAAEMAGQPRPSAVLGPDVVGASVQKKDALEKALGTIKYGDDMRLEGALRGKVLFSAHPHAEILGIDTGAAKQMPGVQAVLTAKDVPGDNVYGPMVRDAQVMAMDKVRFIGEPVVVVFAETEEQAEAARDACRVEYRPLPGVFTPEQALAPDAPQIHPEGNIHHQAQIRKGDVDQGFAAADVVVEGTYTTPFIEHAYLEPEAGLAEPTPDGGVKVMMNTQYPFGDQRQIADALGIPTEKVQVVQIPGGGAFGAKNDITLQILLAMGALATGRPVKMVLTRGESLRMHVKKHANTMHYRTGATRDGKLVALLAQLILDTGAYGSWGIEVTEQATVFSTGPYEIPNVQVDSTATYTNNVPCGAMRGFGINQVTFAMEAQMDALAEKLGMDPFAIRRINAMRPGSTTSTGQVLGPSVGLLQTLDEVEKGLASLPSVEAKGRKIGIGVASCFKNVGLGLGAQDLGRATAQLLPDGKVLVRVAACEIGQGSMTAAAQMAAQTLNLPYDKVEIHHGDTGGPLDTGPTCASRTTFIAGNAVVKASRRLGDLLSDYVAEEYEIPYDKLQFENGLFVDARTGHQLTTLTDLAKKAEETGQTFIGQGEYVVPKTYTTSAALGEKKPADYINYIAFGFGTQAARVAVDENTGAVEVLDVVACHDVGKAINPQNIRLQIEGSVMMGLGYALSEEFKMEEGWNVTDTLGKCGVPRARQAPKVVSSVVEVADPNGPFGAKGLGEIASLPTAPAIINAVHDATGARVYDLPATKSRILEALGKPKTDPS
ncbi:MAG TPA: molybdopterin cofactor-binding domain-containing protein [Anaerolineae bacterium]|nr:molybdopterin cofactor-binding domain-containing protein [Anaerolineae bacterium]